MCIALLLGVLNDFAKDPLKLFTALASEHDIAELDFGLMPNAYFCNHPDYIKHILLDNNTNYIKDKRLVDSVRMMSGKTMFTSDGDFWLKQRRTMQPIFHKKHVERFASIVVNATKEHLDGWRAAIKNNSTASVELDIQQEMLELSLKIIGQFLFSVDLTKDAKDIGEAFCVGNHFVAEKIMNVFSLPLWLPTKSNSDFKQALKTIDNFLYSLIDLRRCSPSDNKDLLTLLMAAEDPETKSKLSDKQIHNEMISLFAAGHDTTASTLMWTIYLLSQNSQAREALYEELDTHLKGMLPQAYDLHDLEYNSNVVKESLRIFPSGWALSRRSVADDKIGGHHIPAGSLVFVSPYTMHRHPDFWENPHKFEPSRFNSLDEKSLGFSYFPFGGGPRICIGKTLALLQAQLIIACIMQDFQLDLKPGHKVEPLPVVGLHSKYGMPMLVRQKHPQVQP